MNIGFNLPENSVWSMAMDKVEKEAKGHKVIRGMAACKEMLPELDVIVSGLFTKDEMDRAKNLKAIFVPLVGVNHLPLALFKERNLEVYNCHGNAESVAERALALALAGLGRVVEYHNDLLKSKWHGFWVGGGAEDNWKSIYGMQATILGTGAIGQALARMLKAFNCTVKGWRRRDLKETIPNFDHVGTDIHEALKGSELVFAILPLTDQTKGIIDAKAIETMEGAYFVNVGRGDTVDEEALYNALKNNKLKGAGIDVWFQYPKGPNEKAMSRFPYWELPNVVLSPHIAGTTHEATLENVKEIGENILLWLDGKARDRVNLDLAY